jgi:hypothetical protein
MTSHFARSIGAVLLSGLLAGCAASADDALQDTDQTTDESHAAAWRAFVGAWEADSGAFPHLVFDDAFAPGTRARAYWAERTVYCVRAPCPPVREAGTFRATSRELVLTHGDTVETYRYSLRGGALTLRASGRIVAELHSVASYCAVANDCDGQDYGPALRCRTTNTLCTANRCTRRCVDAGVCHADLDCPAGQRCATESCGGAGTCAARPDACAEIYHPVCGCDGRTYGNACEAATAGASVAFEGECTTGDCRDDAECDEGYFCSRPGCGVVGNCRSGRTVRCDPTYSDPVCGCDGVTYTNWCVALTSRVSVAHAGACH